MSVKNNELICKLCGSHESLESKFCSQCGGKLIDIEVKLTGEGYGINLNYRFISQRAFELIKSKYSDESNEYIYELIDLMQSNYDQLSNELDGISEDDFTETYWIQSFEGIDEINLNWENDNNNIILDYSSECQSSHDTYPVGSLIINKFNDFQINYPFVMIYKLGLGKLIDTSINVSSIKKPLNELEAEDVTYNNQILYLGSEIEPIFLEKNGIYTGGDYTFEEVMVVRTTDLVGATFNDLNGKAEYLIDIR